PVLPDFPSLPVAAKGSSPDVDFTYPPAGSSGPIGSAVNSAFYTVGAVLEGFIDVPATGFWTFSIESDGATRLLIGGSGVIPNQIPWGPIQETSAFVALAAGRHALRIEYAPFGTATQSSLALSYSGPGVPTRVVPAAAFSAPISCRADFNADGQRTVQDIF